MVMTRQRGTPSRPAPQSDGFFYAVRVTFADGSVWDVPADAALDLYATREGTASARLAVALGDTPDPEFLAYCIQGALDDLTRLNSPSEMDRQVQRAFCDFFARRYAWPQVQSMARLVEAARRGERASDRGRAWPRAEMALVRLEDEA